MGAGRPLALAIAFPFLLITPQIALAANGCVRGVVRWGSNPVPYSDVVLRRYRIAAQTDEAGRFFLRGVPAGRETLEVRVSPDAGVGVRGGIRPTQIVSVPPGDTLMVEIQLPLNGRLLRDSLERAGKWPVRLDASIALTIEKALAITVQRLSDDRPPQPGGLPVGMPRSAMLAWRDSLLGALRHADFGSPVIGDVKLCEGCAPQVRVEFIGHDGVVRLGLCYVCGELWIDGPGHRSQHGYFGDAHAALIRFAHAQFPGDAALH